MTSSKDPKMRVVKVSDIRVPLRDFDYIGPVYKMNKQGKDDKLWRIVVDRKGTVYRLEKKVKGGAKWKL